MGKNRIRLSFLNTPPLLLIVCGISITFISLLTKGSFNPFVLLGFIFMAIFESLFRKRKKLPSGLLSLIFGVSLVLAIKLFVVDFVSMKSDIPEFNITKEDRIIYQPAMFRLEREDYVLYESKKDSKRYLAVVKEINKDSCKIYLGSKDELREASLNEIKGKVVLHIPVKG